MQKAVAANGYAPTTVKHVVTIAGVSRRVFYEVFDDKLDCFVATLDFLADSFAGRVAQACAHSDATLDARLDAAFGVLRKNDWDALRVLMIESQTAGAPGLMRLQRATGAVEAALAGALSTERGAGLHTALVPVIVGGLRGMLAGSLGRDRAVKLPALRRHMRLWTRQFAGNTDETTSATRAAHAFEPAKAELACAAAPSDRTSDLAAARARDLVCERMLHIVVHEGYRAASMPMAADLAGVHLDLAMELVRSMDDCFLAALDMVRERLLATAAEALQNSADWPSAVRLALGRVMSVLAANVDHATAIAIVAPTVSEEARERTSALGRDIAEMLLEEAPERPAGAQAIPDVTMHDAVADVIMHTIQRQATLGRVDLLPRYADHVSCAVMTPFLGLQSAATHAEILTAAASPGRSGKSGGRSTRRVGERKGPAPASTAARHSATNR